MRSLSPHQLLSLLPLSLLQFSRRGSFFDHKEHKVAGRPFVLLFPREREVFPDFVSSSIFFLLQINTRVSVPICRLHRTFCNLSTGEREKNKKKQRNNHTLPPSTTTPPSYPKKKEPPTLPSHFSEPSFILSPYPPLHQSPRRRRKGIRRNKITI